MKIIRIVRGGQAPMVKLYDTFDSVLSISDNNKIIKTVNNVNTDFCNGYKGGILAEGIYAGICCIRQDNGKICIKLFDYNYIDKVKKPDDISDDWRIFKSLIPNPNHANNKFISAVLIHQDGQNGGWSHGCITIYYPDWDKFISEFAIGEKVMVELVRDKTWKAPTYYQGK